jgi:hypothetical protein
MRLKRLKYQILEKNSGGRRKLGLTRASEEQAVVAAAGRAEAAVAGVLEFT